MINPLPLVLADLRRSRAGAAAVVALIGVAVALGVAVTAEERALRAGTARAADAFDLVVGARGSPAQLVLSAVYLQPTLLDLVPGQVLKRLEQEPGIAYAAPVVFGDAHRGFPVVGSTVDFVTRGGGRALAEGRVFESEREVVLGADVSLAIGASFTPAHGRPAGRDEDDASLHTGFAYVAVGRLARSGSPWDRAIIAPVEALWRLHARPTGHAEGSLRLGPPWDEDRLAGASAIIIKPRSVADAYRLRARYRDSATMAVFPAEVLFDMYAVLGDARDLLWLVALATQALVVAAILLAVFASLSQRRRQLGVLRALGASRRYVFLAVWLHVSLLVALGAGLGVVLGWGGARALSAVLHARTGVSLPVALSWTEIGMAASLAAVGAVLAAIPSWHCYRQPVSSLLRG